MPQPQLNRRAHRGQHLIQQQLFGLVVLVPLLLRDAAQALQVVFQHNQYVLQRQRVELVDGVASVGDLQGIRLETAALARRARR